MRAPAIQLLSFEGCPLAAAARLELRAALAECGIERYEEIDLLDPKTPQALQGWGSPTILVDGSDVAGQPKGSGISCRVYPGRLRVPTRSEIIDRIAGRAPASS